MAFNQYQYSYAFQGTTTKQVLDFLSNIDNHLDNNIEHQYDDNIVVMYDTDTHKNYVVTIAYTNNNDFQHTPDRFKNYFWPERSDKLQSDVANFENLATTKYESINNSDAPTLSEKIDDQISQHFDIYTKSSQELKNIQPQTTSVTLSQIINTIKSNPKGIKFNKSKFMNLKGQTMGKEPYSYWSC